MAVSIDDLLRRAVESKASDLHLKVGNHPYLRVDGLLAPLTDVPRITPEEMLSMAFSMMTNRQKQKFKETAELDMAYGVAGLGRFRVNVFQQRGNVGMVLRVIPTKIRTTEELNLPQVISKICEEQRGLVLVTGTTGSGKSTTLAAMIDHVNQQVARHVITVEDPIEFMHEHKQCLISQREIGFDTHSYENALKNTLRQAPDVILIGEVRERETMEHAIAFAETGHLCLCTLHANSANQALDRIINFFPEERRLQLLMDLSLNLKGLISQRLIPLKDMKGRAAAIEILLNSPLISDLIFKGEVHEIKEIMKKSRELGMQTFDQALFDLYEGGRIGYEDAMRNADSMNELRLQIKLHGKETRDRDLTSGVDHLNIV
jgi:twitching motility protein PilU